MRSWLKRIRATIGIGVTWAAAWGLVGALIGLIMGLGSFGLDTALEMALLFAAIDAAQGFVGGVTFATVLRLTEGRRRFDELRLPRFAAWGGLGGFLIGAGYAGAWWILADVGFNPVVAQGVAMATVLGAASAAGSLAVARFADDRQLLEAGQEAADVGLSPDEKRKLLGDLDVTTT